MKPNLLIERLIPRKVCGVSDFEQRKRCRFFKKHAIKEDCAYRGGQFCWSYKAHDDYNKTKEKSSEGNGDK